MPLTRAEKIGVSIAGGAVGIGLLALLISKMSAPAAASTTPPVPNKPGVYQKNPQPPPAPPPAQPQIQIHPNILVPQGPPAPSSAPQQYTLSPGQTIDASPAPDGTLLQVSAPAGSSGVTTKVEGGARQGSPFLSARTLSVVLDGTKGLVTMQWNDGQGIQTAYVRIPGV
jgi:outer membrane biosynthesis protein TonB